MSDEEQLKMDIAIDRAYINGARIGFICGQLGAKAYFLRIIEGRRVEISAALREQRVATEQEGRRSETRTNRSAAQVGCTG